MRCSELEKLFHWPDHDKLSGRYKLAMTRISSSCRAGWPCM